MPTTSITLSEEKEEGIFFANSDFFSTSFVACSPNGDNDDDDDDDGDADRC